MESGIYLRDGSSTEEAKSAGPSPLGLRVGVFLILLCWALAPTSRIPSAGSETLHQLLLVTTTIVVAQTILGLNAIQDASLAVAAGRTPGFHDLVRRRAPQGATSARVTTLRCGSSSHHGESV